MATYDLKYPGAAIDAILDTAYDLQNAGYIFRGLASEYSNTPTERSWVLAGEGETGHGFTTAIPKGYIGVCVFDGTSWTGKLVKCVSIDSTPTPGSTNAVSSGGAYAALNQLATGVAEALDNMQFTDVTPPADQYDQLKLKLATTDSGIERIITYLTFLSATTSKAGLLSAADKAKLDAILGNLRSLEIDDTTAYADLGTKIVESIKATIGGTEETISTFQILAATASKAGLLSAADKAKLDAILGNLRSLEIDDTTAYADLGTKIVESIKATIGGTEETISTFQILAATAEKAGLLSAADKQKLDAILGNLRSLKINDTTAYADLGTKIVESIKATIGGTEETISTFQILAATASKAGLLSAADKAKLDALWSSGYQFAGIATPSTTPISTTSKIFYIATEAGTYFNAVTVTQGINVLLWDGTAWSAVQVVGIDDEPTPASGNLVKSGGIFPIKMDTSELELLTDYTVVNGGYLRVNNSHPEGEFVTNGSYQIWVFPVVSGNYYAFSNYAGASAQLHFLFWISDYDTSGSTPSFTILSQEPYQADGTAAVRYTDQPVKAPTGAVYAAINVHNSRAERGYKDVNFKIVKSVQSSNLLNLAEKNKAIISESIRLTPSSVVRGKFLLTSGEYQTASYYNTSIYDVIGGNKYLLDAYALARNAGVYVLFWLDSEQNILLYQYTSTSTEDLLLKKEIVQAPANAVYAAINIRPSLAAGYSFSELGEYIDVESINSEIRNKADIAAISEKIAIEPVETFSGKFFKRGGTCASLSVMSILKFPIDENTVYSFTGRYPKGIDTNFIAWLDSDGEIIDNELEGFMYAEPYKGSMNEAVSYYQQEVTSPAGAMYAVMNQRSGNTCHLYKTGDVINISELKSRVDNTNLGLMEVTINGNPKTIGSSIIIRTSYDSDNDIVTVYHRHENDNITPLESYLGSKSLTTSSIMASANKFHSWGDSTSPLRNGSNAPWHMFAQHGYEIPVVNCTHNLTSNDVGTIWTDQLGRSFTIGKVETGKLYLLPEITGPDSDGLYNRPWKNHTVSDATISTLTKDSTTITIDSQTSTQIRPIQESTNFNIIADGTEITSEGVYMCNDLIISETLLCYNPFTVETWYPTPVKNTIAVELVQSFSIHGLSHRYDTVLRCIEPLKFSYYGATQAQCLVSGYAATGVGSIVDGYDGYVFVPKVKTTVNGNRADIPHVTSSSNDDISFTRNSSTLYDVDEQPDREISYLYDSSEYKYLAGFATGVSLLRGGSIKAKRNQYIDIDVSGGSLSYVNRNKFYVNLIAGVLFPNNALPAGFIETFSTYFSYFNPEVNKGQVYWYKDGSCYVIYAHYQDANENLAVTLPSEMDGLQVEVVEKTEGVTLATENIVNGKIYLNTDSSDHNYIVLKTK